jgi:hypothetical protein
MRFECSILSYLVLLELVNWGIYGETSSSCAPWRHIPVAALFRVNGPRRLCTQDATLSPWKIESLVVRRALPRFSNNACRALFDVHSLRRHWLICRMSFDPDDASGV